LKTLTVSFLCWFCLNIAAQDMRRVRANIDTLASPALHGRGYVNNGSRLAADFIASQFKRLTIKPFGDNYFQPFTFNVNTFPGKASLKIDGKTLKPGEDFILNAISGSGKGKGEIVWLDSLIFESEAARRDFVRRDFRKNVLVYPARQYGDIIQLPIQYLNHLHEAAALIELQDKKLTGNVASQQLNHPIFEMTAASFPLNTRKARFNLEATFIKDYPSQNVIGFVEGKIQPDTFIVITAHYDHLGQMGKKTFFPGANDNASGIAMLLELADFYAKPEHQPDYSVCFMAFGGEEMGLLGSKIYNQHPLFPLTQIRLLLNLDLVGTGDEGITIVNVSDYPEDLSRFQNINAEKKYLPKINRRNNAPNSDHYIFARNGVRAFFIYTLGGIKAYHDVFDRPQTLPLTRFEGVFGLIKDFIQQER
jgi:aminopeptidase YwaD